MLIVRAAITAKEGKRNELLEHLRDLAYESRWDPGCFSYVPLVSAESENIVILLEEWADKAALDAHMRTAHFMEFSNKIIGLFNGVLDITLFEAVRLN